MTDIKVTPRARVDKPEFDGSDDSGELGSKEVKPTLTKSPTLKPDIDKPIQSEDPRVADELAEVAAEKKAGKESNDEAATEQKVKSLVDSKKYFVPVGQVTKRRNIFILILLFVLVPVVVAAVILLR